MTNQGMNSGIYVIWFTCVDPVSSVCVRQVYETKHEQWTFKSEWSLPRQQDESEIWNFIKSSSNLVSGTRSNLSTESDLAKQTSLTW